MCKQSPDSDDGRTRNRLTLAWVLGRKAWGFRSRTSSGTPATCRALQPAQQEYRSKTKRSKGQLTLAWILGRKAFGFRSRMASTAAWRSASCAWLLQQLTQLQPSQ